MSGLFDKVRKLLGAKAEPEPAKPTIPQSWLNEAQKSVGSLYSANDLAQARAAEASASGKAEDVDTTHLRQMMLNHLSVDDLTAVANQMRFEGATLEGGKGRRVMGLLMLCEKAGRLGELLAICQERTAS